MSITVVLDHPRRHLGRRLWRRISSLIGGLLVVFGLTASIPAVPASLAVIGFVLGWATTDPSDPDQWPTEDVPVREIFLGWAVTTPIAIGGIKGGLRLLRRNRTLICFCDGSAMTRLRAPWHSRCCELSAHSGASSRSTMPR